MKILSRAVFREIFASALLGTVLFTFVLFLQKLGSGKLFEILARSSAPPSTVAYLFALVIPVTLTFTLPVGVLVGTLIGLSRMSSDGEITGMRAAGVPSRKLVPPILLFASMGMAAAAAATLWLTPLSMRETYRVLNRLMAAQLTAEIQPRVFEEQFPNTILYVADVVPGPVVRWRKLFLADLRPAAERSRGGREKGDTPRITLAREAIAVPDQANNRIQLSMRDGSTYETGKDPSEYYITGFPAGDQVLQASPPPEAKASRPYDEMDTLPLWREASRSVDARIALHQRLALPLACVLLALVGIPLGISSRKAGKSSAFVLTVAIALLYWMGMISLINLARQGTLPVSVAVWTPNTVFALAGLVLMLRLEEPGDRDVIGAIRSHAQAGAQRLFRGWEPSAAPLARLVRLPVLPQLLDTYVLSTFLFYFALLLASFVLITHVFTFFELLSDIVKNKIPMTKVFTYLFFLTPKLIYDSTPMSVLVAVLVTFGVMSKHNEVTAFKASGVSLYRLAVPVLLASMVLSGALFAFDHYYVPGANRKQDALRNEIKNRPVQTYLRPDRKWIFGQGPRIYYYKYFDPNQGVMGGVSVYELDMDSFALRRHISAERAHWEQSIDQWIFENGWTRDIRGAGVTNFRAFRAEAFGELNEPPAYFMKEAIQDKQMNFVQLEDYIRELRQSGFDTVRLQVQLQKKFSVPLFAIIMALISVPFAFLTGSRGAMAGVGVSFGIAIAYWALSQLFEQFGNINQLPATLAAWSPDAIFCLAGVYLIARMKT